MAKSSQNFHLLDLDEFSPIREKFDAAIVAGRCPSCTGDLRPSLKTGQPPICAGELWRVTWDSYRTRLIEQGFCPSCGGGLVKLGRRAKRQRFRCTREGKVYAMPIPPGHGLVWRDLSRVDEDELRRASSLFSLGWKLNRIAAECKIRRVRLLELFGKNPPLFTLEILNELRQTHIQFYRPLWLALREAWTAPPWLKRLPNSKPWRENVAVAKLVRRAGALKSSADRIQFVKTALYAVQQVLVLAARGQFSLGQVRKYSKDEVQQHAIFLVGELSLPAAGGRAAEHCVCGCPKLASGLPALSLRLHRELHGGGLCEAIRDLVEKIRTEPGLWDAFATQDLDEVPQNGLGFEEISGFQVHRRRSPKTKNT